MDDLYQHYKGHIYRYKGLAKLEATNELMVIYESLETKITYVRPFNEWAQKFKKITTIKEQQN